MVALSCTAVCCAFVRGSAVESVSSSVLCSAVAVLCVCTFPRHAPYCGAHYSLGATLCQYRISPSARYQTWRSARVTHKLWQYRTSRSARVGSEVLGPVLPKAPVAVAPVPPPNRQTPVTPHQSPIALSQSPIGRAVKPP
eukprot:2420673-Rhodomonas_salina.1